MEFLQRPLAKLAQWMTHPGEKYVYNFDEASGQDIFMLGSKGASLCELTKLQMPIPPGFTITTEACRNYLHHECQMSPVVEEQYRGAINALEKATKCKFGSTDITNSPTRSGVAPLSFPMLLSVRSSTAIEMVSL
jgi:pyruvate,orthophosphate dikinase